MGELIRGGSLTTGEITDRLIWEGMPALEAISWLDRLHQDALLTDAESCHGRDHGPSERVAGG